MIEIKNLNKTYDRRRAGENHVLHDISFSLPDTGFVCILGPSGCGKTSLLNAIGGLDEFDNGTITVDDVSVSRYGTALYEAERNRSFGYIFQNYYLLSEHSVGYNVYLGLHSLKLTHEEKLRRVRQALEAVEMDRYIRRNVAELSGGQQQRVAIARALARKPRVIFADEPTGNLDEANTLNICSLLRKISRTSLVIMVTHEERIARFFADRIITLDSGRLSGDSTDWERSSLSVGSVKSLYTGDYARSDMDLDKVSISVYQEEGIEPVKISVVALRDRIVIKLDDHRAISCGSSMDSPELVEGPWPMLTLEEVDRQTDAHSVLTDAGENIPAKPGSGITFGDMVREAGHMTHGKKLRGFGTRVFLVLLAVLMALSVADIVTLFSIDPEDFITAHSNALEVVIIRGPMAGSSTDTVQTNSRRFKQYIEEADIDFISVPDISYSVSVHGSLISQAGKLPVYIDDCSFAPMAYFDESTIIMGRLPENPSEAVVDRWVLDAILDEDGVVQNSIEDIDYFLEKQMEFGTLRAAPTIVGICDGGQPAVYLSNEMLASVGTSGTEVMALSTFRELYPQYAEMTLGEDECIVLPFNAGEIFEDSLGGQFNTVCGSTFTIVEVSDIQDCYAKVIVDDSQIPGLMLNMALKKFWIYCDSEDKDSMTEYMLRTSKRLGDQIDVTVIDHYEEKMAEYEEASRLRADARSIVTVTVMVLSAVMLYLLRRADVQGRIGMLSVYRLLGIPSGKAIGIFAIESLLNTLTTVLPSVAAVWAVIGLLGSGDVVNLVFPWYWAALVVVCILGFQLLVTVLPLRSLLRLPPAQLAAKYDF